MTSMDSTEVRKRQTYILIFATQLARYR